MYYYSNKKRILFIIVKQNLLFMRIKFQNFSINLII